MERLVNGLIGRYGGPLSCRNVQFRGFLQPSGSLDTTVKMSPLGRVPTGKYLYIGPGEVSVSEGDILVQEGREFVLRRVEPVYFGEKRLYIWGLCALKGEA